MESETTGTSAGNKADPELEGPHMPLWNQEFIP